MLRAFGLVYEVALNFSLDFYLFLNIIICRQPKSPYELG